MGTVVVSPDGKNRVASIKTDGTRAGATFGGKVLSAEQQQELQIASAVNQTQKGSTLTFVIANGHATATQSFILFDQCGAAAANGATAQGADITITSSFAGLNSTAGYTAFKAWLAGSRVGSIGTSFLASDESVFVTLGLKVWTGNIENYQPMSLQQYLLLAKDNYANDQKILNVSTKFYVNPLFALTGAIPAGESLTVVMNVPTIRNF